MNAMCGGWRQDKPAPYRLVLIRELAKSDDGKIVVDLVHVGFWGNVTWCALCNHEYDGTPLKQGMFKGIGIVNIYGWKEFSSALE